MTRWWSGLVATTQNEVPEIISQNYVYLLKQSSSWHCCKKQLANYAYHRETTCCLSPNPTRPKSQGSAAVHSPAALRMEISTSFSVSYSHSSDFWLYP